MLQIGCLYYHTVSHLILNQMMILLKLNFTSVHCQGEKGVAWRVAVSKFCTRGVTAATVSLHSVTPLAASRALCQATGFQDQFISHSII